MEIFCLHTYYSSVSTNYLLLAFNTALVDFAVVPMSIHSRSYSAKKLFDCFTTSAVCVHKVEFLQKNSKFYLEIVAEKDCIQGV